MTTTIFLDLGKQPITNNFLKIQNPPNEFFYNLKIMFNDETKLVSLADFVPPEKMFNETYAHRASMSLTMREAYRELSLRIKDRFNPRSILEIGSNDGVFLKNFLDIDPIGVEPCKNLAEITNSMSIKTYANFWNIPLSNKVSNDNGKFEFIYSANTISHIQNLEEAILAVDNILTDNGVFVLEDPSLLEVLKNISYDQFYDEHAYVFSVTAINNLLKNTELEIFDIEKLTTHGGSNRIYIKKRKNKSDTSKIVNSTLKLEEDFGIHKLETYQKFAKSVEKSKNDLCSIFQNLKSKNNKIIGYGATYKSSTILNYCGLNNECIEYFVDTTKNKQGKFTPGTHIPIIKPDNYLKNDINFVFLGAWNFKNEIFNKEKRYIDNGGKFITHVPFPQII
jgi:SAM-dependent methyltransferase